MVLILHPVVQVMFKGYHWNTGFIRIHGDTPLQVVISRYAFWKASCCFDYILLFISCSRDNMGNQDSYGFMATPHCKS